MHTPPNLKCDKGHTLDARQRTERFVVWNLLKHLEQHGWSVKELDDGGDYLISTPTHEAVMEEIFDLDECRLLASKSTPARIERHSIYIVLGNDGYDVVADHGFADNDRTGFLAVMDAFDGEDYVQK